MTIIVGTDGTECSRAAVTWAAREARRRGERLRIVYVADEDWPDSRYDLGNEFGFGDAGRVLAGAVLAAARDLAAEDAPGVELETGAVAGPVVPTLVDEAVGAELLVLGHRERARLGSVGRRVAADAPCPVVVVCGRGTPGGSVLCRVDGSPGGDGVLAAAFAAADALGCGVVVLDSRGRRRTRRRRSARQPLDGQLARWRAKFPGVPAGTVATRSAGALVAGSRDARLVVVGAAGRRLLRQSGCPVLVAR